VLKHFLHHLNVVIEARTDKLELSRSEFWDNIEEGRKDIEESFEFNLRKLHSLPLLLA